MEDKKSAEERYANVIAARKQGATWKQIADANGWASASSAQQTVTRALGYPLPKGAGAGPEEDSAGMRAYRRLRAGEPAAQVCAEEGFKTMASMRGSVWYLIDRWKLEPLPAGIYQPDQLAAVP